MKKTILTLFVLCLSWYAASEYEAKANEYPVPSFTYTPMSGLVVNQTITFNASASYDPDGSIDSYVWDFGDGTEQETGSPTITHSYFTEGTYHPSLDLVDDQGLESDMCFSETLIVHALSEDFPVDPTWDYRGEVIDYPYLWDVSVTKTSNGSYRLYGGDSQIQGHNVISYASEDGVSWAREDGLRLSGVGFMAYIVNLTNGSYRMYYTGGDTVAEHNYDAGSSAIRSAASENGINFTLEDGDRLLYDSGSQYETGGIRASRILLLPNGTYRMYYHGLEDLGSDFHWRILSAVSDDGLTWTREAGVRMAASDMCPAATRIHNIAPVIDSSGTYHLYVVGTVCGMGESLEQGTAGIFDMTSSDGLVFTIPTAPLVAEYYNSDHRVGPHDPFAIRDGNETRLYFYAADGPTVIDESGIYLAVNEGTCSLLGDSAPCGEITLSEVIAYITLWTQGQAQLTDVIALINAWAADI